MNQLNLASICVHLEKVNADEDIGKRSAQCVWGLRCCLRWDFVVTGAYLLSVMWSDQQVPNSPFKVNVLPSGDASRVVCIGDGLTTGILGRENNAVIDTRKAGLGEFSSGRFRHFRTIGPILHQVPW